ncbi:MAG: M14 family metallopeptidase [Lachnospiraceae bacterium]|nr:M14 family metallopeptidase [Lachnospiraceae bacterium]
MRQSTIFEISSLYRDNFRVSGYTFGNGEKAVCVLGSIRGNEIQQIYTCSLLVERLKELEENGAIHAGKKILVIPSGNPYSMNISKRFWPTDNTDINRMFPGYHLGETTQRIAAGIFETVKDYQNGIQLASFYMPGNFMPHVRMMKTGFEDVERAREFGLPYIVLRTPRPYDTTTLNYNWQIWETHAYSLYTTTTERIDPKSAAQAVRAMLNFMAQEGILDYRSHKGYCSEVVDDRDMRSVRTSKAGIFECCVEVGDEVKQGDILACVRNPYDGSMREKIQAPQAGTIFFAHDAPLVYESTAVFKMV